MLCVCAELPPNCLTCVVCHVSLKALSFRRESNPESRKISADIIAFHVCAFHTTPLPDNLVTPIREARSFDRKFSLLYLFLYFSSFPTNFSEHFEQNTATVHRGCVAAGSCGLRFCIEPPVRSLAVFFCESVTNNNEGLIFEERGTSPFLHVQCVAAQPLSARVYSLFLTVSFSFSFSPKQVITAPKRWFADDRAKCSLFGFRQAFIFCPRRPVVMKFFINVILQRTYMILQRWQL